MPKTKVSFHNNEIVFAKTFVSGNDLVTLNGEKVFEGKLVPNEENEISTKIGKLTISPIKPSILLKVGGYQIALDNNGEKQERDFDIYGRDIKKLKEDAKNLSKRLGPFWLWCIAAAIIGIIAKRSYLDWPIPEDSSFLTRFMQNLFANSLFGLPVIMFYFLLKHKKRFAG